MKTWFITGASTGIGRCIAEAAFKNGDKVCGASIDPENMQDYEGRFGKENVLVQYLDISNEQMCKETFAKAVAYFGHIDVLVNCAGFMQCGPIEAMATEEVNRIVNCNFYGTFFLSREAARHMRERKSGTIVQIASLSAVDVIAGEGMYGATKMAVKGMSQALHAELAPFGVKVIIVEPGPVHTNMAKRAKLCKERIPAYDVVCGAELDRWEEADGYAMPDATDPAKIGALINRLAYEANPPREITLGSFAYKILNDSYKERLKMADEWKELSDACDEDA